MVGSVQQPDIGELVGKWDVLCKEVIKFDSAPKNQEQRRSWVAELEILFLYEI
jgi:hypothetical protein